MLHPLQTESVDYIAGRSELVCAVFALLAWLIFLRYFDEKMPIAASVGVLACAGAAILSKESGVCVAAALLCCDFYWKKGTMRARFLRIRGLYISGFAGLLAVTFLVLRSLGNSPTAGFSTGTRAFDYALTQCRSILTYLSLFVWPAGQSIDWRLPTFHSFREEGAWLWVAGIAVLLAGIVLLWRKARMVSFGLLLFLLMLMPTSSVIPLQDNLAERRMYLPMTGLIIAVVGALSGLRVSPRMRMAGATAVLASLAVLSYNRSRLWSDDRVLWEDVLARDPGNTRAHTWLAGARVLHGDCAGAAREYKFAADIEGLNPVTGMNLGAAYECSHQSEQALATFRALVATHPYASAYNRIGYLQAVRNNVGESLDAFDRALQLEPDNATAHAYRGTARMALKETSRAQQDFLRALELEPNNAVAKAGLSQLLRNTGSR